LPFTPFLDPHKSLFFDLFKQSQSVPLSAT
jgi:hypothetical protein